MKIEVKKNTKKNIVFGALSKIILLILPFIMRMVINNTLGAQYLGLNSLFNSILTVLSISELGISSALVYNMYKPIAEDDYKKINAILNLYKKSYRIIGIVISVIGIMIIPTLNYLINDDVPKGINIYAVYLIQLLATVVSYFLFSYRQSLLVAYQREDVNSIMNLVVQFALQLTQIIVLLLTKNYYVYVVCLPIFTVINNIWINYITKRMFPETWCEGELDSSTMGSIRKLVIGTFIQKACATTRNSLDSICISALLGLVLTGIYNNYFTVFNGITVLLSIVSTSLVGGIGNHVVTKDVQDNYEELKTLDFIYMLVSGWCTICLLCLSQPFMKLWMGEKMMLSRDTVILMCAYFYILKMGDMKTLYSTANGLWWQHRYRSIAETILNIVLNITLGLWLGVNGVVLATIISLFVCNFLWASSIIFGSYFKENRLQDYFRYHLLYAMITAIVASITYLVSERIPIANGLLSLLIRAVVCATIPSLLYFMIYSRTHIFKKSISLIKEH